MGSPAEQLRFKESPAPAAGDLTKQRLVICLDGTWNKRDSGTNIYHLSNLITEGEVSDQSGCWIQQIFYDPGVGTGMLDGVTGGAFGIGLSANVREAYDWLVERYNDGDEVYIFGFSRGAFTARSLAGMIAKCGLLRRGAPISPEEVWSGYRILGRIPHEKTGSQPAKNWWERIFGRPKPPFRPIWLLKRETWDEDDQGIPVQPPQNRSEELLRDWSRRIKITCVGVFDTVGSMGLDALAIPWLREQLAQFHDTHLTTLIVNGFQAFALDEHRANFIHIPWHRATGSPLAAGQTQHGGRIEQRWFIGAHSNVGGGYDDDDLARFPLAWFVAELRKLGLAFRTRNASDPDPGQTDPARCVPLLDPSKPASGMSGKPPRVRDSFAEFAPPLWQHIIRAKRNYRHIAPPPELQNGKPVQSVNEVLDSSVLALRAANAACAGAEDYLPPNIWEYLTRTNAAFSEPPPPHRYLQGGKSRAYFAVWLAGIGFAGWNIGTLVSPSCAPTLPVALPLIALIADWCESILNHRVALEPSGLRAERRMAWMDCCLAIRLCALALFAAGIVFLIVKVAPWLLLGEPRSHVAWLFALDALFLYFAGAMAWCGGPMTDAGLGSIVKLQMQTTPDGVVKCLTEWANGSATGEAAKLLAPVARSLWRDILGFIPAYSIFLFIGTWLALSLAESRLLDHAPFDAFLDLLSVNAAAWVSAALVLLCAVADYVEDAIHLRYLAVFPSPPSRTQVVIASLATRTKFVLFGIALALTCLAAATLGAQQLWYLFHTPAGDLTFLHGKTGGLGILAVAFSVVVFIGGIRDFVSKRK
jgi:uncharacterized protein (DUF2235 family)